MFFVLAAPLIICKYTYMKSYDFMQLQIYENTGEVMI